MKRMMKCVLLTASLALPTLANAGDGWNGFYLGGDIATTDAKFSAGGVSLSDSAAAYGLHAGYNHTLSNNLVIGGELSYGTAEYTILGLTADVDTTRLKAKLGYDLEDVLVYGILGYTSVDDGSASENGITFGIGVSFKATDNIILGAELLRDSIDISGVDFDVSSLAFRLSYQF